MQLQNTNTRYGLIAILFHWVMALLIIGLLILGWVMVRLPIGLEKLRFFGWHKEYGLLVLLLAILRIAWRLSQVVPILPAHLAHWEKWAAHAVHYLFYIFMFLMPISGWLITSATGLPASFFGIVVFPDLVAPNEQLRQWFIWIHQWSGYGLVVIILLHISAALQHHFIYKDDILRRMFP